MSRLLSVAILLFVVFFIVRAVTKHAPDLPEEDEFDLRERALDLLRDEGYQILSMREEISCGMQVDGEQWNTELVADFTVRRDGQMYVVKMREDGGATSENTAALRRELLPYYLLYRPSAVLYLDPEDETIQLIEFDIQERGT